MPGAGMQRRFAITVGGGEIGTLLDEPARQVVGTVGKRQGGLLEYPAARIEIAAVEDGLERCDVARPSSCSKFLGRVFRFALATLDLSRPLERPALFAFERADKPRATALKACMSPDMTPKRMLN